MFKVGQSAILLSGAGSYPLRGLYHDKCVIKGLIKDKLDHELYTRNATMYKIEQNGHVGYAFEYQLKPVFDDDSHLLESI